MTAGVGGSSTQAGTLRFDGRVAVVTGAAGSLGRHYAMLLASRGARVVVNDVGCAVDGTGSDRGPAEHLAAEIVAAGGEAVADENSVQTVDGGAAVIAHAVEAFGRIDIVINNAGILRDEPFGRIGPQNLDAVLDIHVRGAFNVTQPAWERMREQGYGRVVMTSSASGVLGGPGQAVYGTAKMGLAGLTRVLAAEGARAGIKVNAIAPLGRSRMDSSDIDSVVAAQNTPLVATPLTVEALAEVGAALDPARVAPVVAWLAHEHVGITGEIFTVGGGRVARYFVGLTRGFFDPELSPESVRDHVDAIRATDSYTIPGGPADEVEELRRALAGLPQSG